MRWLARLMAWGRPPGGRDVVHPDGGFESACDAMQAIIDRMIEWDAGSGWITFMIPGITNGRRDVTLELADDGVLNTLRETLSEIELARFGLERCGDRLYRLPGDTAAEWAGVVDALFRDHFGAEADYPIHGRLQA